MKAIVSRNTLELLITVLAALVCIQVYHFFPLLIALVVLLGAAIILPLLFKKPEYGILFIAVVLPFRDIHLVSIIHLKRFIIWSVLFYILTRRLVTSEKSLTHSLQSFNKITLLFVASLVVSLIKTASQLYTTTYITPTMLKASVLSEGLVIVEGIFILYIMYFSMNSLTHLQRLLDVIIATSMVIATLGILQYFHKGPVPSLDVLFDPDFRFYGRATSVFSNPNDLGGFAAPMLIICVVSFFWHTTQKMKKMLFILPALVLNSLALLMSFSRGAMLQVLCSIVVIGYLYYVKIWRKKLSWKVALFAVVVAGCLFSAVHLYDVYMRYRLESQGNDYYKAVNRLYNTGDFARKIAAIRALETFLKHPVLGVGYNLFAGKKIAGFELFGLSPHNQYLKILAEMGLLGFLPFALLIGLVVRAGVRIWDRAEEHHVEKQAQTMMLLLLSGLSANMAGFLFADSLSFISISGYLWIFLGAILVIDRRYIHNQSAIPQSSEVQKSLQRQYASLKIASQN